MKTPRVLLVADPGFPVELARRMQHRLPWDVSVTCQRLSASDIEGLRAPAGVESDDGQVAVMVTDHPCRDGLRPVAAEADPEGGTGVVSLPPLGAIRLGDRATQAVELVVEELCGGGGGSSGRFRREAGETVRFMTAGRQGRLRIVAGMVRANRPWRLLPHLSKAFAAALAVLAYAILNPTIWQLASALDLWRMGLAALLAIAIMVGWLIVNHEMWERNDDDDEDARDLAVLFNAATVFTLVIGVVLLYVGLLVIGFVADRVVVDSGVLSSNTGHPATLSLHLRAVWLAASIATVAGAVGTGFESDEAVRQAAYGYRQREREARRQSGHEQRAPR